jgi:hypothetical protein
MHTYGPVWNSSRYLLVVPSQSRSFWTPPNVKTFLPHSDKDNTMFFWVLRHFMQHRARWTWHLNDTHFLSTLCQVSETLDSSSKYAYEVIFISLSPVAGSCESVNIWGPFETFVDWRQCAAVTQMEEVTVMPSCSGGGEVVVAWPSSY